MTSNQVLPTTSEPVYEGPQWAAGILNKSTRTMANWRSQGKGPRFCKVGNSIFYDRADVFAFLEKCKRGGE